MMSRKDQKVEALPFSPGEWVVHSDYGVGQITAIEKKQIGGEVTTYYRVETDNSIVWVPVDLHELLRPVVPPDEFAEAVEVLKRPSRKMSSVFQTRLSRIRKAREKGTPVALARIVRDLWARQKRRGELSNTEHRVFRKLTDKFLAEWAVSMKLKKENLDEKLYALLRKDKKMSAS